MKKMNLTQKRIMSLSLVLLAVAAFLPIWRIDIWAPQYPEGLSMQISLSSMSGSIEQVNILNHYVGMKHIVPNEIPELRIVPPIFAGLILLGAIVLWLNRQRLAQAWFALMVLGSVLGLTDLYLWGYDYGHNLNPLAPIKIPGMSFQPPLFGHKTILNIDSYSLPDWGGYLIGAAMAGVFLAFFWDILRRSVGQVVWRRIDE